MIILKILLKQLGFYLLFLILITFFCSLLNLLGVNSTITNFILFIFNALAFLVLGYKNGNVAKDKGFLHGLKIGAIMLVILFIINIFLSQKVFTLSLGIYYLILLLCATFGGMLGISKKKDEN